MKASITLLGRLGADPERKGEVVRLRIATDRRAKVDGEWGKVTTWWQVAVFGKQAEFCERFLQKGAVIMVEGEIGARDYTDKDGNKRQSYEVAASSVTSVVKAESDGYAREERSARQAESRLPKPQVNDDIPF